MAASERDEWLRAAWRVLVAGRLDARRLVFVDEMGANTSLAPIYAWAPRGRRAYCSLPRNRGPNTTLLASMTLEGMGPPIAVVGSTTREVFEAYVERILVPTLRAGQIVVMDNLAVHKGERVRKLIEAQGCKLLYLPPYSPDFNPIEEAFSKVKGLLRKAGARTREALVDALGAALEAVTAEDAQGFFKHCGYTPSPTEPTATTDVLRGAVPSSQLLARRPPQPTISRPSLDPQSWEACSGETTQDF
jgi:transposase